MSLRMLHLQNETNASCPDLRGQNYRASFHTHSSAKGPRKKIYHGHLDGKGPRKGESAVVKMFRSDAGTEEMCDTEIEKHKLARRLAHKFNKTVPDDHYKIRFTLPLKSKVERLGVGFYLTHHKHRHMDKKEWVLIEENLVRQGEYQIFVRKTGDRLCEDPTTLDAFLHFTYHESGGQYVMCGFQGVQIESGYLLTTPCIHSTENKFGSITDKGPAAIRKVFRQHRCNNLCYSFDKPDLSVEEDEDDEDEDEDDDEGEDDSHSEQEGEEAEGVINDIKKTEGVKEKKKKKIKANGGLLGVENPHLLVVHSQIEGTIEETEEEAQERRKSLSIHRKDSKKTKDGIAHRSKFKAVGELKKQPSL